MPHWHDLTASLSYLEPAIHKFKKKTKKKKLKLPISQEHVKQQ